MKESEFKEDLQIDPNALDVNAGEQSELYFKWAKKAVAAREAQDEAKLFLDICEAELSSRARLDPDSFGIARVTETAVLTAVRLHPKYEEAQAVHIKARKEAAILEKAVAAMEQRKRMIELLVTLHGQEYFAGPAVPRDFVEAWKHHRRAKSNRLKNNVRKPKSNPSE